MSRIDELRRRVEADPASFAFAALAEEYRRIGLFESAIDTCRAGLARHPAYLSARATLGRALLEAGDLGAARNELEQVLQGAPENLMALRGLADLHRRSGELELALARLSLARSLAPQDADLCAAVDAVSSEMRSAAIADSVSTGSGPVEAAAPPGEDVTAGDVVPSSPGDGDDQPAAQLAALERFLGAIARARESAAGPDASR
jgi:tetratricopeptide (TPR) repeat protein